MTEEIPIFICEPRTDFYGGMRFFCPKCRIWHFHGRGEGHRVAHCANSANYPHGYEIRMRPGANLERVFKPRRKRKSKPRLPRTQIIELRASKFRTWLKTPNLAAGTKRKEKEKSVKVVL